MARRWQLAVWVLIGLALFVVVLWDSATMSTVASPDGDNRTEAVGDDGSIGGNGAPGQLAFTDLDDVDDDGGSPEAGSNNVLRPTTTTVPTTTESTSSSTVTSNGNAEDEDGDGTSESSSDTTEPTGTSRPGSPSSTSSSTTSTDRSGQPAMTTVYYQDFRGGDINVAEWEIYHSIGHAGWGLRRPSAIDVVADDDAAGGHMLQITAQMGNGDTAGQLVSGGMKLRGRSQTYGRYQFRARVEPDPDQATSGVVLLWPADNDWPSGGEIDVLETWVNRATRAPVESNLHWAENGQDVFVGATHGTAADPVSGADWHVYTLDWRENYLAVSVDDGEPVVLSTNSARIPQGPMDLTVQLDAFDSPDRPGQQPIVSAPVKMFVDWIKIERLDT